jgi:carbonic anhydrase
MSATAPIDIQKNTNKICSLNCSYSFTYTPTTLRLTNEGTYLLWQVDKANMPPVVYNAQNYEVVEARLYRPSLHTFAGTQADAELIINHTSTKGNGKLLVCIPITVSSTSTTESVTYFDQILTSANLYANNSDKPTMTYDKPSFTLGKFVPMKPYYSYSGTLPYEPYTGEYNYVVFHKDAATNMSPAAFNLLKGIISTQTIPVQSSPSGGVFYNNTGPVSSISGDIYIDCQPTDSSGEVFVSMNASTGEIVSSEDLKKILNDNMLLKLVIGSVLMFVIWKLGYKIINALATKVEVKYDTKV